MRDFHALKVWQLQPTAEGEFIGSGELSRRMRTQRRWRVRAFLLHMLARDLHLIQLVEYQSLNPRAIELKRMLSGLIQKLTADR